MMKQVMRGILALLFVGGCVQGVSAEAPDPADFAILPWNRLPADTTTQTLADLKDCGFNLAGFAYPAQMEMVRAAGLKAFVVDNDLLAQARNASLTRDEALAVAKKAAAPFLENPAVYGYYLIDEPGAKLAPTLGLLAHAVKEAHPQAIPYVNLLPTYASARTQLEADSYEAYLETYAQALPKDYLSYDHYALMADGSLRDGYFQNLEAMRKVTLAHGMPFWNIVLSNAHFTYAEPTPAGFRFQAYTSLAYGARGISYFTYFGSHTGNYRLSPIDPFGNKTPTWQMLREVNLALHRLAPVYRGLKSVNVFHLGNVPAGCQGEDSAKLVATVKFVAPFQSRPEQLGLVVGEFEDAEGTPYAMIVNKSLHDNVTFDMTFKASGSVEYVSPYTGQARPFAGENKWLAAGQGMLLRVGK